jgi:hypothetical protein
MNADDASPDGETRTEPQSHADKRKSERAGRACRTSRKLCLPCIPCYLFSAVFFVLVLVLLWLALRG